MGGDGEGAMGASGHWKGRRIAFWGRVGVCLYWKLLSK